MAKSECAICSEKLRGIEKLCHKCGFHQIYDELLTDPALPGIASDLGMALRWQFYIGNQVSLHNLSDSKNLIAYFNLRDPMEIETKAVALLVSLRAQDPFGVEVLHPLTKIIGESPEDARVYVEKLAARHVIRVEWLEISKETPGMKPFPRLCWWARCGAADFE